MATVFRARDRELRRDVAVKVLFPHLCKNRDMVSRFHREARAAAALDHPHILRVFDVGGGPGGDPAAGDPPYIVLELIRGRSLEGLAAEPPLAEIVAALGAALAAALDHAHRAGVIHRDVKPGNVLAADDGRVVLGDFGVARVADDSSVVTRSGALLGTPAFMSPEQATGGELDARSDLYSLGATLYQLATGSLPVSGGAARAVAQIAAGEVVPPLRRNPRIGVDLARIIERLMRVDPAERFAAAGEVEAALRALVAGATGREPDVLLREFLAEPTGCQDRLRPVVVAAALAEASADAAAGRSVRALALVDRVLALEPGSTDALALLDRIGRGRARRRAATGVAALAAVGAAAWAAFGAFPAAREPGAAAPTVVSAAPGAAGSGGTSGPGGSGGSAESGDPAASPGVPGASSPAANPGADSAANPGADSAAALGPTPAAEPRRRRPASRPPAAPRGADADPAPAAPRGNLAPAAPLAESPPAPLIPGDLATPPPPSVAEDAVVTLEMDSWCDATVAGRRLGQANPRLELRLAPGAHTIVCAQDAPGRRWSERVVLAPGQRVTLRGHVLPPSVAVSVALSLGDSIRVDRKQVVRHGARVELPVGRHRIELLARGVPIAVGFADLRGPPCVLVDEPRIACR